MAVPTVPSTFKTGPTNTEASIFLRFLFASSSGVNFNASGSSSPNTSRIWKLSSSSLSASRFVSLFSTSPSSSSFSSLACSFSSTSTSTSSFTFSDVGTLSSSSNSFSPILNVSAMFKIFFTSSASSFALFLSIFFPALLFSSCAVFFASFNFVRNSLTNSALFSVYIFTFLLWLFFRAISSSLRPKFSRESSESEDESSDEDEDIYATILFCASANAFASSFSFSSCFFFLISFAARIISSRSFIILFLSRSFSSFSFSFSFDVAFASSLSDVVGFSTVKTNCSSSVFFLFSEEVTTPPRNALGSRFLSTNISKRSKQSSKLRTGPLADSSTKTSKTHLFTSSLVNPRASMAAHNFCIARDDGSVAFAVFEKPSPRRCSCSRRCRCSSSRFKTRSRTRFSRRAVSI